MLTKNIFRATATAGQYIDNNGDDRSIASINSRLDSIVNLFFFWQRNLSLCSNVCLLLRSLCYTSPLFSIFCVAMGIVVCWMRALFAHFCPSPLRIRQKRFSIHTYASPLYALAPLSTDLIAFISQSRCPNNSRMRHSLNSIFLSDICTHLLLRWYMLMRTG